MLQTFLIGEHGSKMRPGDYFRGLVSGSENVFVFWFSPFLNALPFIFPLAAVLLDGFRRRRVLSREERFLWLVILTYLVVFTLPSKRSPSYVLTIMPALATLLGP